MLSLSPFPSFRWEGWAAMVGATDSGVTSNYAKEMGGKLPLSAMLYYSYPEFLHQLAQ